jgi:hypothetical protein
MNELNDPHHLRWWHGVMLMLIGAALMVLPNL